MKPYVFNVAEITDACIKWIQDWMQKNGNDDTKVVIGISGGKDSTVVAALCAKALGKERVLGVMMPNGVQPDISDSQKIVDFLQIPHLTININNAYTGLTEEIKTQMSLESLSPQYLTNTPARLRMTTLYGIGAIIGNARVVNTCNRSEDVQGYSTVRKMYKATLPTTVIVLATLLQWQNLPQKKWWLWATTLDCLTTLHTKPLLMACVVKLTKTTLAGHITK
jgi:hypothetical protein